MEKRVFSGFFAFFGPPENPWKKTGSMVSVAPVPPCVENRYTILCLSFFFVFTSFDSLSFFLILACLAFLFLLGFSLSLLISLPPYLLILKKSSPDSCG
jgi:hypothetical protein